MTTTTSDYDVVIAGGGLAGLCLSIQLLKASPDLKVLILERRKHPVKEAAFKVGESSVELGAHYFAEIIGLRDHIKKHQLPKLGLRYFFPSGSNTRIEERVEFGGNVFFPAPSYQLDRGRLENHLGVKAAEMGAEFLSGTGVRDIELNEDCAHTVMFKTKGQDERTVTARWVVDSTGRSGFIKSKLGLEKTSPHNCNSVWFRIGRQIKIDDWSDQPAWQKRASGIDTHRWLSTNHLMGEGYWVWLIPLASGATSVGIVCDASIHAFDKMDTFEKALDWLREHEPQCAGIIEADKDLLQDFLGLEHFSHEATQVFSKDRWALTGEAGLFLDPFYSPGSDYIGISNTMVSHLILEEIKKPRSVKTNAPQLQDIYRKFFDSQMTLYHMQYPIMRNPFVMSLKIIWDFAYYWAIPAFIFFNNRICDLQLYMETEDALNRGDILNRRLQALFRTTNEAHNVDMKNAFVDVTKIDFMYRLNAQLKEDIAADAMAARLEQNVDFLERLQAEMKQLLAEYPSLEMDTESYPLTGCIINMLLAGRETAGAA